MWTSAARDLPVRMLHGAPVGTKIQSQLTAIRDPGGRKTPFEWT
jgi:hypothetical protein